MSKRPKPTQSTRAERITTWVERLSRSRRIALNIFISLVVMAVVGLPIVYIFGQNASDTGSGEFLYLPTLIITVIWFAVYWFGWLALVGFDWDPNEPWHAGSSALWMIAIGLSALFLLVLEIIFGLLFGYAL